MAIRKTVAIILYLLITIDYGILSQPVKIVSATENINLQGHFYYLEDTNNNLTIEKSYSSII